MHLLSLLFLAGWASSHPSPLIEPSANKMVHQLMDVIESGMEDPVDGEGRAFWIGFTLSKTSTVVLTETTTVTVTPSCVDGMFMECGTTTIMPTTTTMPAPRKKNKTKKNKNKQKHKSRREMLLDMIDDIYREAVVTDEFGDERDVSELFPDMARSIEMDTKQEEELFVRSVSLSVSSIGSNIY